MGLVEFRNHLLNLERLTHAEIQYPDPDSDKDQAVTVTLWFMGNRNPVTFTGDDALLMWNHLMDFEISRKVEFEPN
jgi:hypothetical protein